MNTRRDFIKKSSLATLAASIPMPQTHTEPPVPLKLLKPALLREGATVSLIAPGSPIVADKVEKSLANLKALGFQVKEGQFWKEKHGFLAGTDEQRLADLHRAFEDPETEAVWCARGGYGCSRLLHQIDFQLIKKNPKPLIGYSDITALHIAIHQKTGLVTFHGPVAASDYPENTLAHLKAVLMQGTIPYPLNFPSPEEQLPGSEYLPFVIRTGKAQGPLTGGNLSLLSAMAGTPWAPKFKGKLVFMEDIGEQPYRIDRMLTQLLDATDLKEAAGIALGVFSDCQPKGESSTFSLTDTLRLRLQNLQMPIAYGFPFGHVAHQATFPMGIRAEMDTEAGTLTFLEAGIKI